MNAPSILNLRYILFYLYLSKSSLHQNRVKIHIVLAWPHTIWDINCRNILWNIINDLPLSQPDWVFSGEATVGDDSSAEVKNGHYFNRTDVFMHSDVTSFLYFSKIDQFHFLYKSAQWLLHTMESVIFKKKMVPLMVTTLSIIIKTSIQIMNGIFTSGSHCYALKYYLV